MFQRAAMRRFVRTKAREGNDVARRALLMSGVVDMAGDDCYCNFERTATGGWQSFFEWLLDHADEIMALIAKLIAMFFDEA